MRGLANVLMGIGVLLGVSIGLGILLGVDLPGVPWLVAIGLVKLSLAGSIGLIAAGAVVRRLAHRAEERERQLPGATNK